jgi:hypothetical protein
MGLVMANRWVCAFLREASRQGQPIPDSMRTQVRRDSGGGEEHAQVMENRVRVQNDGAAQGHIPAPIENGNVIRGM